MRVALLHLIHIIDTLPTQFRAHPHHHRRRFSPVRDVDLDEHHEENWTGMPNVSWVLLPALLTAAPAFAANQAMLKQLEKLDPDTRLEQRCDIEAMDRISAAKKGFKVDKVVAYTFAEPVPGENSHKAPGAVFRSDGEWYRLSYTCTTSAEHIDIKSFDYRIGSMVPRAAWTEHYLYD